MTTIYARTDDQVLVATRLPKVACNNQNTVKLSVKFDSTWDGYAKSAVFYTSKDPTPYEVILSSDGNCLVPAEVLIEEATLYIGVKGVKTASGEIKASALINYRVLAGTPSAVVSAPSAGVYAQLMGGYVTERARLNNMIANGGSSNGDEVVDARVGHDGTVYPTLFEAIAGQVAPLAHQVKAKNLIDFSKLTRGYFSDSGVFTPETGIYQEATSDFIAVDPASTYYFGHRFSSISAAIKAEHWVENWFGFCLYDADKVFMKRVAYDTIGSVIEGEVFAGASYVRVSYRTYMFNRPIFAECSVPCDAMDLPRATDNLIDNYPLIFNGYSSSTNGLIAGTTTDESGYIPSEHNELTSDFIPCTSGDEMFIFATATHDNFIRIAFYSADGGFVSSFAYHPTSIDNKGASDYENILDTFVIPEGAVAMRVSCRGAYIAELVVAHNDQRRKHLYAECERKYLSKYDSEKINHLIAGSSFAKSIAHRGFSAVAPENTLAAYRLAKQKGFDYVECDVSFTADGAAVLLHDATVDRTSDGTGNIAELTLDEVRALDFGSWKSAEYAGEKIPTFEEFILLCKRLGLHPYIELKAGTEAQIKGLVDTVKRCGMKGKVTWISFTTAYLTYVKAVDPYARLGLVVNIVTAETIDIVRKQLKSGNNEVIVDSKYENAVYDASTCADADIPLEVWTINDESALLALNPYVSGFTSDNLIASNIFYDAEMGG